MSATAVSASGLSRTFGAKRAVHNVSFDIRAGEVFCLLGPNGSGKSTLLRMLVGFLRPDSGEARIGEQLLQKNTMAARQLLGYVPEDTPLYEEFRVIEFLTMMCHAKDVHRSGVTQAIARVCAATNLQAVTTTLIRHLSRGYRQRVAIAQALLNEPPLLVFDEPTNGLDPRQVVEFRELIRTLAGQHTIIISTHVLSEVAKIADRVGIMMDGCLLAIETVDRGITTEATLERRFIELTADIA